MKATKRIFVLLLAIALLAFVPGAGTMTAAAADPATYTIKYVPSMGEWRVQKLNMWDENRENGDMNFLWGNLQDGDLVVVNGMDAEGISLTFEKYLSNLTLYGVGATSLIYAKNGVKDVYVLKGSITALNGDFENVYVYDDSICNINNDVKNVYVAGETKMSMDVAANGTVDFCQITNLWGTVTTMYNIQTDSLRIREGKNETDPQKYSTAPGQAPAQPAQPAQPAEPGNGNAAPTSPKTGENSMAMVLLAGAAICFAGGLLLRKRQTL